jgi:16S rRNA (guanine966-N2)-methyltransferase
MEFYAASLLAPPTVPHSANTVRIIGGRCRGRVIRFARSAGLRPTPDRVRETLFNWLGQDLAGQATLEPYAGSGVLSLEALSRGAALAVAADVDARAVATLRANAALLELSGLVAERADAKLLLAKEARTFDVVFLDPPFASDPWSWLLPACARLLRPQGFVYAESSRAIEPPAGMTKLRAGKAGQVVYHLFEAIGDRR